MAEAGLAIPGRVVGLHRRVDQHSRCPCAGGNRPGPPRCGPGRPGDVDRAMRRAPWFLPWFHVDRCRRTYPSLIPPRPPLPSPPRQVSTWAGTGLRSSVNEGDTLQEAATRGPLHVGPAGMGSANQVCVPRPWCNGNGWKRRGLDAAWTPSGIQVDQQALRVTLRFEIL